VPLRWLSKFTETVKIQINGETREIEDGLTVGSLLEELQIRPARVVIELNRDIVSRDVYASTRLNEGDALEIVHFVGGG
jgi:thiamine biosynthesis protein ThiS